MTELKYSTDTRTIRPGECFVAICGERYDGHSFILEAIAKGAPDLVVERDVTDLTIPSHIRVKRVDNSVNYLAEEASKRIGRLAPDIIAVTGSVGKTTTKKAIATVLSQSFPVVVSRDNLNTLLGLSLTALNELSSRGQKLVVEIGAYKTGDIARTCYFVPPRVSVVTNVYPVHLERMKTLRNIALAKRELVEALPANGVACLNWDDHRVRAMASHCKGRVMFYGKHYKADITPQRVAVDVPLLGPYAMHTALAAFCVGICLGMSDDAINQGLACLEPEKGRLVTLPGANGITLLDDTYNASLPSVLAALKVLEERAKGRGIAFLGDMLELGKEEAASHRKALEYALSVAAQVIVVGSRMSRALEGVKEALGGQASCFANSSDVVAALRAGQVYHPEAGDWVLVKGSAGVRMERVVEYLLSSEVDASSVLVRQGASWKEV